MADRVVYADRWQRHRAFAPRPRSNKRGTPCPWEEWSGGRERFGAENNRQIERLINHVKNLGHVYCNLSRNNLCACYRQRCFRRVVRSKRNCIRRDFSYWLFAWKISLFFSPINLSPISSWFSSRIKKETALVFRISLFRSNAISFFCLFSLCARIQQHSTIILYSGKYFHWIRQLPIHAPVFCLISISHRAQAAI